MTECTGKGECFRQCGCSCFELDDEDNEVMLDRCTCGHRNHVKFNGGTTQYCQTECKHNCVLVECANYKLCGTKYPQYILNAHNGKCLGCELNKITSNSGNAHCQICFSGQDILSYGNTILCLKCYKAHFYD
jgi:hypothetical protein